jgi:hypothetical protein
LRRTIAAQATRLPPEGRPTPAEYQTERHGEGAEPKPDKPAGEGGGKRGSTKSKLTIHEEKTVKAAPGRVAL